MDIIFTSILTSIILFSLLIICSKNPLHSIIYLILVFSNIVFLLLVQEITFISMILIIIYMGAIAVLFLFIIYTLNLKLLEFNELNLQYLIGIFIFFAFFMLFVIFYICIFYVRDYNHGNSVIMSNFSVITNADSWYVYKYNYESMRFLGEYLYIFNFAIFILISLILLVAMLGVITLTAIAKKTPKEQVIHEQNNRFFWYKDY